MVKTLAKDRLEAYSNMCKKYKTENEYAILRMLGHSFVGDVEFFYHDLDEMETI